MLQDLLSNRVLWTAIVGWFAAQALKVVSGFVVNHKLDWKLFFASGGMPSSHTSFRFGPGRCLAFASVF